MCWVDNKDIQIYRKASHMMCPYMVRIQRRDANGKRRSIQQKTFLTYEAALRHCWWAVENYDKIEPAIRIDKIARQLV